MSDDLPVTVRYLGEYEDGHHVCDIRRGGQWYAQVRFQPATHKFFLFQGPGEPDPLGLRKMDYDALRAYCKGFLVSRS